MPQRRKSSNATGRTLRGRLGGGSPCSFVVSSSPLSSSCIIPITLYSDTSCELCDCNTHTHDGQYDGSVCACGTNDRRPGVCCCCCCCCCWGGGELTCVLLDCLKSDWSLASSPKAMYGLLTMSPQYPRFSTLPRPLSLPSAYEPNERFGCGRADSQQPMAPSAGAGGSRGRCRNGGRRRAPGWRPA